MGASLGEGIEILAGLRNTIIRSGLETLYFSGAHLMMRPFVGGVGMILMLHRVRQPRPVRFQPNGHLEVRPRFLERVIRKLRRSSLDIVSLDEMHRRLVEGDFKRRFVCLTFDDGYRDTLEVAYPILKKHEVPFALYVATSFPDRLGELWWLALEAVIAKNTRIGTEIAGKDVQIDCSTLGAKREVLELATLAADPLVTIGAHTVNHVILGKASERVVRHELEMSRSVIEAALNVRPFHLAYPVGDRAAAGPREFRIAAELGYKTAVTTRPGVLFDEHREHLTALPRIALNGDFQQMRYAKVLMSGAGPALANGFRRVNAA
jgi:peptidoglycan/xylan/chitin deacetylase (PgdA/CDA1 family)